MKGPQVSFIAAVLWLCTFSVNAGIIIDADFDGSNTTFSGQGTIDLNSTLGFSATSNGSDVVNSSNGYVGVWTDGASDFYNISNVVFSGDFGNYNTLSGSTGDAIFANSSRMFLTSGYVSNELLSVDSYRLGAGLLDFGQQSGNQTLVSWSNAGVSDFIQINWNDVSQVPEPSIIALFGLGLVGIGFARRRRS
jgi:hypothetical protein